MFLERLFSNYELSADGTHAGIVSYGGDAYVSVKLNQFTNNKDFMSVLERIQPRVSSPGSNVAEALLVAKDELLSPSNGARNDSQRKLIVIMSDISKGDASLEASRVRKAGIHVSVVVMPLAGKSVSKQEANEIATSPADVYYVTGDGQQDEQIVDSMVNQDNAGMCYLCPFKALPIVVAVYGRFILAKSFIMIHIFTMA